VRVLHVSDCYLPRLGGIESQVHHLARRQRLAGHDVHVVTATPVARHDPTRDDVVDGVPVHRAVVDLPYELPLHPRPGREVLRVVAAHRPDVVHLHVGVLAQFAQGALRSLVRARVPLVVTVHSLWGPAAGLFRAADRLLGWGDWPVVLTAVSRAAAEPVRAAVRGRVEVGVLPNGIDVSEWQVPRVSRDQRGEVLVAAATRLAPRKRPLPLLASLRDVRAALPAGIGLRAVVAGEGPQRGAMERYLRRHGMDWVELPGRLDATGLRELYARADVYAAPAVLEAFGIAALEARTAGLPLVARAGTGVEDFVTDGVEGLLAGSDPGFTAALHRLAADPALRARIAAHNRAVPPPVGWDDVVAASVDAYARAARLVPASPSAPKE
jgi:glycosyltransferase involved in cell wall biosynthesis